jgi:hypothetical protein
MVKRVRNNNDTRNVSELQDMANIFSQRNSPCGLSVALQDPMDGSSASTNKQELLNCLSVCQNIIWLNDQFS